MRRGLAIAVAVATFGGWTGAAQAAIPDPSSYGYTGLADVTATTGTATFDTDNGQISGAITRSAVTGVGGGIGFQIDPSSGLAVFDFGSLNVPSGVTITYTGSHPLGLLSTGAITIAGQVNADGLSTTSGVGTGGRGQFVSGFPTSSSSGGGGGGFGNAGATGGTSGGSAPGGSPGVAWGFPGDVSVITPFPSGASGGAGALCTGSGNSGGRGGGGIAIVALGALGLTGAEISAEGAQPATVAGSSGGGGGSGGAVLVAAPSYTESGTLFPLWGGRGGLASSGCAGTGGAGGYGRLTQIIGGSSQALAGPPPASGQTQQPPVQKGFLSLDGPTTGTVGVPTSNFTSTVPIGQLATTSWNWGDGTTSSTGTHTYSAPGTYTVTATGTMAGSGAITTATQAIAVTDTLDHIALSPPSSTTAAGVPQSYTANGFDSSGGAVGDRTAQTSFSITPSGGSTGASCTANACGATLPGTYTVTGSDGGKISQATLTVTPGPVDHLTLSPSTATVAAGTQQQYAATGYDRYGNSLGDVTSQTAFAISPGSGSCAGAACTASEAGTYTVTGSDGPASGSATLTVVAKPPPKSPPPDQTPPPTQQPANAPKLGTPKLNPGKGTAQLPVKVTVAGKLVLQGSGIKQVRRKVAAGARVTLVVTPTKATASRLKKTKRLKLKLTLIFTPDRGKVFSRQLTLTLRRR